MLQATVSRKELELSIIGTMLLYEDCFYHGMARLTPEDFVSSDLQEIFKIMKRRFEEGQDFEKATFQIPLDAKDKESIESSVLYAMEFALESEERFKLAVERLIELSKERRELQIAEKLVSKKITREEALAELSDLERDRQNRGGRISDITVKWLEKQEELYKTPNLPGITTGSKELDEIFTYRNELTLICARPSIGKTITALTLALNQAKSGVKVQFFSLELTEDEVMARLVSIHSGIPLYRIVYAWEPLENVIKAAVEISELPIYVEPGPLTLPQIKAKIYEVKPDVVYIDYVQKISEHKKFQKRKDFLDYVSFELLELAKTKCPIVALAQLNRGARTGRDEPMIEHIKETGNFEQDASNIILLHRNFKESPDKLQLKVAKCRVNSANRDIVVDFVNGIPLFTPPLEGGQETFEEEEAFEF